MLREIICALEGSYSCFVMVPFVHLRCAPDQLEDADAIEAVRQSFEVKMSLATGRYRKA